MKWMDDIFAGYEFFDKWKASKMNKERADVGTIIAFTDNVNDFHSMRYILTCGISKL
jgi:hypothetical protein